MLGPSQHLPSTSQGVVNTEGGTQGDRTTHIMGAVDCAIEVSAVLHWYIQAY